MALTSKAPEALFGNPGGWYHTVDIARWNDVEGVCNYAASIGWRLHTLRDSIRGHSNVPGGIGYRLIFERGLK